MPIDNAQWDGAGTFVLSDLITNAPDEANGVWFEANTMVFEGAQDGFETRFIPTDVGQDLTWTIPDTGQAVGSLMFSTLATNNIDVDNSIWFTANTLNFAGATGADGFEHQFVPEDPVAADMFGPFPTWTTQLLRLWDHCLTPMLQMPTMVFGLTLVR